MIDKESLPLSPPSWPVESWPQRPVQLIPIPDAIMTTTSGHLDAAGDNGHCPVNRVFTFETPVFKGQALIRIRGLDEETDASYFAGRQRLHQVVLQGRFLRPNIRVADVVTGAQFSTALRRKPPALLERWLRKLLARRIPGISMDLQSVSQPYVYAPFVASLKAVRADVVPDHVPSMDSVGDNIQENSNGFGPQYATHVKNARDRKKFLATPAAGNLVFDTDCTYTFEVYNEVLDYYRYQLNLKVMHLNMASVAQGEPFPIMAKISSTGEYLWGWHVWHESLLSSCET